MKRYNVYDAVNRERLLGTHLRWSSTEPYQRWAAMPRLCAVSAYEAIPDIDVSVAYVSFDRVTIMREGGWEAEVALVTYSKLEDLMCLRDFRLPGEDNYAAAARHWK